MAVDPPSRGGSILRTTLSSAAFVMLLIAIMFLPAGIGWRTGWVFLLVFLVFTVLACAYLWRANPEIFVARSKIHAGSKSWDKVLMVLILAAFLAVFMVAGFDARYGWSSVPLGLIVAGYLLFALGYAMSVWVYAVNKFAEPSVRIQSDRGQRVVDAGPYAIVRHPLYAVSIILMAGVALALGSYPALMPVAAGTMVLIVRTFLEDRTLQNELDGYRQYATRVRYRLIPGLW